MCIKDHAVAAIRLAAWLHMSPLDIATEIALRRLSDVLQLGLDQHSNPPNSSLESGKEYYAKRIADMVERAQQLEQSRMVLRKKVPVEIKAMDEALDLEQPSKSESLVADLPHDLISVVEETADGEIELHFSLSNDLNALTRLAYGLKGAEMLSVHLKLDESSKICGFCVHVAESEEHISIQAHTYYQSSFAPDRLYCQGRLTRLTYIVSRYL